MEADAVDRNPLPGDADAIYDALERFLPAGRGPLLWQRVCLYTNTPDGHFIVDDSRKPRVSLACGFSGQV